MLFTLWPRLGTWLSRIFQFRPTTEATWIVHINSRNQTIATRRIKKKMVSKRDSSTKTAADLWHESFSCDTWGDADLEDLINGNFLEGSLPDQDEPDLPTVPEKPMNHSLSSRTLETEQSSSSTLGFYPIEAELSVGRRSKKKLVDSPSSAKRRVDSHLSPKGNRRSQLLSNFISPRREGRRRPPAKSLSVCSPRSSEGSRRLGTLASSPFGRPSSSRDLMKSMPEDKSLSMSPEKESTSNGSFTMRSPGFLRRSKSRSMRNLMKPC